MAKHGAGSSGRRRGIQGSSLSGRRFGRIEKFENVGSGFDFGRISDYDVAIVSKQLFPRAKDLGVSVANDHVALHPIDELDEAPVAE